MELDRFRERPFATVISTFAGYAVIIAAMFLVLFVLPFLLFWALG